jgi:hypothetical protein
MSRAAAIPFGPDGFTSATLRDPIAAWSRMRVTSNRFGTPLGEALAENDRLIAEKRNMPGAEGATYRLLDCMGGNHMQLSLNAWLDNEFKRGTPIGGITKALATLIANVLVIPALRTRSPNLFCDAAIVEARSRTSRVLTGDSPVKMVELRPNGQSRASTAAGLMAERDRG